MQIAFERLRVDENCLFHFQEFKQDRFTSPFHLHDEFELILVKRSHGKLYVGNEMTNFSDGEVYLFAPGLPHCFHNAADQEKEGGPAHAFVVQFRYDFLGKEFFEKTESFNLKKLLLRSGAGIRFQEPSNPLSKKIQSLSGPNNLQRLGNLLFVLSELANSENYTLLTSEIIHPDLSEKKVINDVIRYVADNFQQKISLAAAAEIAHMQKSAFCRYFKKKTKKKFMEFVNETRLVHAQKLLVETDRSILDIAYESGYESVSYFYRLFRQRNGIPPMAYRKQNGMT